MRNPLRPAIVAIAIACVPVATTASTRAARQAEPQPRAHLSADHPTFNRDIRPILSDNCFSCHGPDANKREADLRLDTFVGATRHLDADGRASIIPGHPDESELIVRITTHDPDDAMPPPKTKKLLSAEEILKLQRWIRRGAEYEPHWAFIPIKNPPPPATRDTTWPRNPIDRFILARLESVGLTPSDEADRRTLIRRLSLDLAGLLPTPSEVDAFINDSRPDAYERLVDQLLASPHYGERWGRHWLDQARYADSHGYTVDGARTMWPYRDWVIAAVNADMPFNQFTIEQLAGDLLPDPTTSQLVATGFHRNTLINQEGGTDDEQFRNETVVDRVNTTGAVWLGLTLGCAQCHSHKFDPISQREYYQLFAFFNQGTDVNNRGAVASVTPREFFPIDSSAESHQLLADARSRLKTLDRRGVARRTRWETNLLSNGAGEQIDWQPLDYQSHLTESNAGFTLIEKDNSLLTDGRAKANDTYQITALSPLATIAALRLNVITDPSLPNMGPGTAGNGNFVLSGIEVRIDGKPIPIASALASHAQPDYPIRHAIDGKNTTGWAVNTGKGTPPGAEMNRAHEAHFVFKAPIEIGDRPITVSLKHQRNPNYLIGRFSLAVSATPPESQPLEPAVIKALIAAARTPSNQRTRSQSDLLMENFRRSDRTRSELIDEIAALEQEVNGGPPVETMVMRDLPPAKHRPTHIQIRGNFLNPDLESGPLSPGVPAVLHPLKTTPSTESRNRLDLARWLVDPANPLTPRVTVNRTWMRLFGSGIVETENDFGAQGSAPSHPALLDWLATEFITHAWSRKHLHRLIVTSATYRQASIHRPELDNADPRNILLARQSRIRVDAEIIRDAALSASGRLNPQLGGPPAFPPQPTGVYAFTQNKKPWNSVEGPDRYRRALYTMFYRSAPYPLFTTFDSPDFANTCTRRNRSNTPLQSLSLANDASLYELARALAQRLINEVPDTTEDPASARINRAFLLCYARPPSNPERSAVLDYQKLQSTSFQSDPAAARAAAPFATNEPPNEIADSAAWVAVTRALLNTDEFITRE